MREERRGGEEWWCEGCSRTECRSGTTHLRANVTAKLVNCLHDHFGIPSAHSCILVLMSPKTAALRRRRRGGVVSMVTLRVGVVMM